MASSPPPRILDGIRVEPSHVLAGPHCGRHLADLGTEVIEVESDPEHGTRRLFRSAMRFSLTPLHPQGPAPARVGLHTREVLMRVLGYDGARIDTLIQAGAVARSSPVSRATGAGVAGGAR